MLEAAKNFEDGFGKFQEYTRVDLRVLYDAGFKCAYDDMKLSARIDVPNCEIFNDKDASGITRFASIKLAMNAIDGKCCILPSIKFVVNTHDYHYEDSFSIIIKTNSRYSLTTEGKRDKLDGLPAFMPGMASIPPTYISSTPDIPIRKSGFEMLKDMAECSSTVLQFNNLPPKPVAASKIRFLVEALEKAGIDKQEIMNSQSDPFKKIQGFSSL